MIDVVGQLVQHIWFVGDGAITPKYIVGHDRLGKGLRHITSCIAAPALVKSGGGQRPKPCFRRGDLTRAQRAWIDRQFAKDEHFISPFLQLESMVGGACLHH
jgi:hypothetical protein